MKAGTCADRLILRRLGGRDSGRFGSVSQLALAHHRLLAEARGSKTNTG